MSSFNISGTWKGFYEHGQSYSKSLSGDRTNFVLNLKESDGEFSGECIDISEDYRNNLKAEIKGFVNGNLISFIKRYPHSYFANQDVKTEIDYDKKHPEIEYTGYYDEALNKFIGEWLMVTRDEVTKHDYNGVVSYYKQALIDEAASSMSVKEYSCSGMWEIEKEYD